MNEFHRPTSAMKCESTSAPASRWSPISASEPSVPRSWAASWGYLSMKASQPPSEPSSSEPSESASSGEKAPKTVVTLDRRSREALDRDWLVVHAELPLLLGLVAVG